eukprot:m.449534 g.449534  ORF g.449534 m.449534 type:complete len:87 (-) comp56900_c0_seq27:860-1120(-)
MLSQTATYQECIRRQKAQCTSGGARKYLESLRSTDGDQILAPITPNNLMSLRIAHVFAFRMQIKINLNEWQMMRENSNHSHSLRRR